MHFSYYRLGILLLFAVFFFIRPAVAQSNDPNYPTAITTNQVVGVINPRPITDPRKTTYYYAFDGEQGDVFINIVTRNFDGDVDIFLREGLRPLSKIVIFSDKDVNETGRIIYLRRSERLILRIQGRPPGDKPANFQIKFAGSFVALDKSEDMERPRPVVIPSEEADTIGPPKDTDTAKRIENKQEKSDQQESKKKEVAKKESPPAKKEKIDDVDVGAKQSKDQPEKKRVENKKPQDLKEKADAEAKKVEPPNDVPTSEQEDEVKKKDADVDPLASVQLVIDFKDGTKIERPMSEIARFSVIRGMLTVVDKKGQTSRYSIFDVVRVTIEPSSITVEPF